MTQASALEVLAVLALAGLLGMAGQIVRAVAGLKKMSDEARAQGLRTFDLFVTSRLVISLIVGFVTGMAAAVTMGLSNLMPVRLDNTQLLVGLAAAGYAGTDFLEAFARNLAGRAGASGLMNVQITKAAPAVIISPPNPSAAVETNPIGVDKPAAIAKKNSARRKTAGSGRARKRS